MAEPMDMTGKKFNRWTVVRRSEKKLSGRTIYWVCKCECGTVKNVQGTALRSGRSTSCGCRSKEMHSRMIKRYAPLPKSFTGNAV